MEATGFPTSADIYLELDGRKIAVVQGYTARASKSSQSVEAFGESEPVATIEGQRKYTLELMEEPLPDYVRYRFSFWEDSTASGGLVEVPVEGEPEGGTDPEIPAGGWGAVHTVRKGETLWGIAWRYGVALTALIAANPQIKNPNLIYPGDQVRIP